MKLCNAIKKVYKRFTAYEVKNTTKHTSYSDGSNDTVKIQYVKLSVVQSSITILVIYNSIIIQR